MSISDADLTVVKKWGDEIYLKTVLFLVRLFQWNGLYKNLKIMGFLAFLYDIYCNIILEKINWTKCRFLMQTDFKKWGDNIYLSIVYGGDY